MQSAQNAKSQLLNLPEGGASCARQRRAYPERALPKAAPRRENLACNAGFSAGWPSRMSRPLAVKGGGACPSMFSTPGFSPAASREEACFGDRPRPCRRAALAAPAPAARVRTVHRPAPADRWQDGEGPLPPTDADAVPPADQLHPVPEALCLESLYRDHSPRLLRSISRRTSSRDEARDLVHEIFLRIARIGASRPLKLDKPEAYLSRMATNLLRDLARTASRHQSDRHVTVDEQSLPGPDQQKHLESRDMLRRMEAAMLKLRPITREIFMAHRLDGLSYSEIADRTGLSVKGVEKHMSKAIAQITRARRRG